MAVANWWTIYHIHLIQLELPQGEGLVDVLPKITRDGTNGLRQVGLQRLASRSLQQARLHSIVLHRRQGHSGEVSCYDLACRKGHSSKVSCNGSRLWPRPLYCFGAQWPLPCHSIQLACNEFLAGVKVTPPSWAAVVLKKRHNHFGKAGCNDPWLESRSLAR